MSCFARAALLTALVALALAGPAHAFGRGWTTSYYYPASYAPVVYPVTVSYYTPPWQVYYAAPAVVACSPVPLVAEPALSIYATPTAAPPSQTAEPPLKPGPTVSESRSSPPGEGRARVGFWNVTGRDLTLTIDGTAYVLGRGRNLTLNLGRQFVWRVDQRSAQSETVPPGSSTLEIVVRR